jgi:signal peptidase II
MSRLSIAAAGLVVVADQITKALVLGALEPGQFVPVTGFFNLVLTYNRGVAFGLLASDYWWKPYFFAAMSLAICAGLVWWLRRETRRWMRLAEGLIVGGAFGNVVDRFGQPGVVDFLDFHLAGYHWPAFNLADCCIVLGVGLLLLDGLFAPGPKE